MNRRLWFRYYTLIALSLLVSASGCDKKPVPLTAKGQIVDTVSNTPMSNMKFTLIVGVENGSLNNKTFNMVPYNFHTDDSGHFHVDFEGKEGEEFWVSFYDPHFFYGNYDPDYIYRSNLNEKTTYYLGVLKTKQP